MRKRPDPTNGATYAHDWVPDANDHHCTPHYPTGHHTPDIYDPDAFFFAYSEHLRHCDKCPAVVNTTTYVGKRHTYLDGARSY